MDKVWEFTFESWEPQMNAKKEMSRNRRLAETETAEQLKSSLPVALQHSTTLAQEKGASS